MELSLSQKFLAEALGGEVGPSKRPEIGVMNVILTDRCTSGVLLDDFGDRFSYLQIHSAEVKSLPEGAVILIRSNYCAVLAISWETRAFSV